MYLLIMILFPLRNCVRAVRSDRAGMGKTLYKTRLTNKLSKKYPVGVVDDQPSSISIPLSQKQIEMSEVSNKFLQCTLPEDASYPRIFHIDIAYGVSKYVNMLSYSMLRFLHVHPPRLFYTQFGKHFFKTVFYVYYLKIYYWFLPKVNIENISRIYFNVHKKSKNLNFHWELFEILR